MADYISREAAIEKITALINESGKYTAYESGAEDACYIVEHEIPAADVQPVVRGEYETRKILVPLPWDGGPFDYDNYDEKTHSEWEKHWFCPNCGEDFGESRPTYNFCPNCGADMREVNND